MDETNRSREPNATSQPAEEIARAGTRRGEFSGIGRRIYLTYRYHGPRTLAFRAATFPLRFTPLRSRLQLRTNFLRSERRKAELWYKRKGRTVCIVIPSYRDAELIERLAAQIARTVPKGMARVIVADDASGAEHLARLRAIKGIEVIAGEKNRGFAANVNRGLAATGEDEDVVVLNSDVEPQRGWLACLQHACHEADDVGVVGARLLYPDGKIQFAGSVRNLGAPAWFDHRYRFKPADWGPASIQGATLAVTGACMYIRRELLDAVGDFDERYPMAYEDVDFCLRAWEASFSVIYCPTACLVHHESVTRGREVGEREHESQRYFWERWSTFFEERSVRSEDGRLRIVYVTEDTGVGGGHRVIFEHLNRLARRGHEVELYTLADPPDWFALDVPVRSFETYDELVRALAPIEAIKVATWWATAVPVWRASVLHGAPVYFVQDIETSYYPDDERERHAVLDSYRPEFHYMTTSGWNLERLHELGVQSEVVSPGVDLDAFHPLPEVERAERMLLALGRSNPLKNLPLTIAAWRALPEPRPELCMFGIEPELATDPGMRYVQAPSDEQVCRLLAEATVFVQTSDHEGFCLPPLESMATGGAIVCTDAHGNRDFCVDGENSLIPTAHPDAVRDAIERLLGDAELRERLGRAGLQTAATYGWEPRIDALEAFFERVSRPRALLQRG
jgi:GT2 family glycosyltransferase